MDRPCRICGHQRRDEIDAALLNNGRYETIAAHFRISLLSILNHRSHLDGLGASHAGQAPAEQMPRTQQANVETLLDQTRTLYDKCFALLQTAEASSEPRTISVSLLQVRRHLRALGDLAERVRQSVRAPIVGNVPPSA